VGNAWEHEWYCGAKAKTALIDVTDTTVITETVITEVMTNIILRKPEQHLNKVKGYQH
jgi:hypothetical protein